MACLDCGRGFHELCQECTCCEDKPITGGGDTNSEPPNSSRQNDPKEQIKSGKRNRKLKSDDKLKDPHSTGRKRAAALFPLKSDEPCEWKGKAYCGGGKYPIIGCINGKQEHRHHGPDKNTLNNSPKNVHRICDDCHNIWHSQNDPTYDSYAAKLEHEPRIATAQELVDRATKGIYVARKVPDENDERITQS